MCAATMYTEAIPLHSIKSCAIIRTIVKVCTTFGLPNTPSYTKVQSLCYAITKGYEVTDNSPSST